MRRREFLQATGRLALAASGLAWSAAPSRALEPLKPPPTLTPADEIARRVEAARPLRGGRIPADIKHRLGATHYDGRYFFTQEPYLLEGSRALQRFGMGVAKLWLGPHLPGYGYNSHWNLPPDATLADVARHPYFAACFALPFSTFVLEIAPVTPHGGFNAGARFDNDRSQFHDLARHLLTTYRHRNVTFILQHWEGDWMLRGKAGQIWEPGGPPETRERCDAFARWLTARQQGVTEARASTGNTRCRVFHAAEVNRVLDTLRGIPTLASHVLPQVALDMISWSSYDGMGDAVSAWHGLEIIRHYAHPAPGGGRPTIYIGEVGLPESGRTREEVTEWWDRAMGVFLANDLPHIVHWELYCNEPTDGKKDDYRVRKASELRGFWLIRPDGSRSFSGDYLKLLLDHAGKRLPSGAAARLFN